MLLVKMQLKTRFYESVGRDYFIYYYRFVFQFNLSSLF